MSVQQRSNEWVRHFGSTDYRHLFLFGERSESDSLWAVESSREILEHIADTNSYDNRSRFFAAEILLQHCDWMPKGALKMQIALIYAEALRENYTGIANPWGLPDDVGDVGKRLLQFGDTAAIALYPLLKCKTLLTYSGSKVATANSIYHYRVKDVAATYLGELLHVTFNAERSPFFRNWSVAKIKRAAQRRYHKRLSKV